MARLRRGLLVRSVVVMLLLWTGADITNSSLCALEQEEPTPVASIDVSSTTLDASSEAYPPVAPQAPHVDDCFCCSHCVEVQDLTPDVLATPASGDLGGLLLSAPRIFGVSLYHPPLF